MYIWYVYIYIYISYVYNHVIENVHTSHLANGFFKTGLGGFNTAAWISRMFHELEEAKKNKIHWSSHLGWNLGCYGLLKIIEDYWLVVWLLLNFSHILGISSSQLTFIFFRGVQTTNQLWSFESIQKYSKITWRKQQKSSKEEEQNSIHSR